MGALPQVTEHDPLNNLLNILVQIANKVVFQIKKICLGNVGASTSHNPRGLHGLLYG
jgi:hypothetical protein